MSEARQLITVNEYLALEERAEFRSEYFHGQIFAVAGGTPEHSIISVNVAGELRSQLRDRPCLVFNSDQRVRVSETGLYTYPDLAVVCAEPEFAEPHRSALLNPILIVEVLSENTEAYDRGDKFAHYRRLPSLRQYVLVASDRRRIECFTRQPGGSEWLLTVCDDPEGSLTLASIGCVLPMPGVYSKVSFPPPENGKRRGPD